MNISRIIQGPYRIREFMQLNLLVLLDHSIHNNKGKMSLFLPSCLFIPLNGFQCIEFDPLGPSLSYVRDTTWFNDAVKGSLHFPDHLSFTPINPSPPPKESPVLND